ncbi:Zn-dependent hydrolase [Georgenia yuyongxinii]|uniref:Zn-dependent hydrolase n=1 Tax=Georgenia yuyongxinii TaxID=2589797 RepID=A0A5B8BYG3_9MICO|nr:Zn-dependent hydrolase [Georgenia yuyongxinii]QDC23408.1 Zn-dependent hydrolase [Georgenia yuyongxinii]
MTNASSSPAIDPTRLWASLTEISRFGATVRGGLDRLALGDHDRAARDYLVAQARHHGYDVIVDALGNIFITRAGARPDLTPVLLGSHLDSQPSGGRFDGTYGVIAGLEVLRALDDADVTTLRPVVLANWTNEEGARFSPSMLGSAVYAGRHDAGAALARSDADGATIGAELARIGYAGTGAGPARVHRSLELHIEQGPVLEDRGLDIGVVTGVYGIHWLDVVVRGRSGHAGTTPAGSRQDALVAASRIVLAVDELTAAEPELRATTGEVRVWPNSRNAIPGEVRLALDLRHPAEETLARVERALSEQVAEIAARSGVTATVTPVLSQPPTQFDGGTVALVREVAAERGYSATDLVSGAGHDSVHLAHVTRAGMIFIPCVGGVSHREDEDIRPEWALTGADVLLHATVRAAAEES